MTLQAQDVPATGPRWQECPHCRGTGRSSRDAAFQALDCDSCHGRGLLPIPVLPGQGCRIHGLYPTPGARVPGLPCPACFLHDPKNRYQLERWKTLEFADHWPLYGDVDLTIPDPREPRAAGEALPVVELQIRPCFWTEVSGLIHNESGQVVGINRDRQTWGVAPVWVDCNPPCPPSA